MAQVSVLHQTLFSRFDCAPSSRLEDFAFPSRRQATDCCENATWKLRICARSHSRICTRSGRFKTLTQKQEQKATLVGGSGRARVTVNALQGGQRAPRRLVDVIRTIPRISKAYFTSPFRRALYGGISLLVGFYVAQTISLTFGALGINDVIAAAICLLFTEYVTKYYHTRAEMTFWVGLLNNFKMGFTYGLFIDAFKLAS